MKRRRTLGVWIVLIVLVGLSGVSLRAGETTWRAGTARAKITPTEPLWMAGYAARDHPAEGVLHDLWIKVLALEAPDGRRAAIVTSDIEGFPKVMYEGMCSEVKRRCNLDRCALMLTCSHTHSAPVMRECEVPCYPLDDDQRMRIRQYSLALEKTIAAKVAEALAQMTPATLWAGRGTASFAVNRRNNREKKVVELLKQGKAPAGPVDHSVSVLAVRTPGGNMRAVVFSYACHTATLSGYQSSGDYAGFAQIALEQSHPGAQAMFYQGCGGDQNPMPRGTVALCRKYGELLAAAVGKALGEPMRPIAPSLQMGFEFTDLDYGEQPSIEQLQAAAAKGGYRARWAKRLLEMSEDGKPFPKSYPYPVQVWKLGKDQLWISLGGEVVVDYAQLFKSRYGPETWVNGYANDLMAYIPSRRVWEEGGYEAGGFAAFGLPATRWTADIQERIAASVQRVIDGLK